MKEIMKHIKILLIACFPFFCVQLFAQKVGTWTSHLPYHSGKKVCEVENKIYCVTENGLFYFDKEDNSTNKVTKDDGLSDIEITSINYHSGLKKILIGYSSGYLDIIDRNNKIQTLNDIYRTSSVIGSKEISNITFYKNFAYLSTDFGVVVLDVDKEEIKETYRNIGPSGEEAIIKNVMIDDITDTVYVQNEFGLCKAPIKSLNLLNYKNWKYQKDSTGLNLNYFDFYAFYDAKLYGAKSQKGIFFLDKSTNTFVQSPYSVLDWSPMYSFSVRNNQLISTYFFTVFVHKNNSNEVFGSDNIKLDGLIDKSGKIWTAETNYGMSSNYSGKWLAYAPSGTTTNQVFGLYAHDDKILSMSGGYNGSYAPNYNGRGFAYYSDLKWTNINRDLNPKYDNFQDPLDAAYDPIRKKYFISHYYSGVIVWDGANDFIRLTKADSATVPFFTVSGQTRIPSVTMDKKNNLWFTNNLTGGAPSIHKLKQDNTWESFKLQEALASEALDLVIDNVDQKWILAKGKAVIVWNDITKEEKTLSNTIGKGALPSSQINCLESDRNGQIWVGTDKGVAVFTNPSDALKLSFYEASLPIFERRPLLQDEQVLCIAVDGANRKWFGTTNGAFLFNENATESVFSFNTSNSLLPSNFVKAITVNEKTGEVFFGTTKGMVSYWGDASEPAPDYSSAKIFPNPINPNFDGFVSITGLKENSIVKITDISGKLIYEQTSKGGTATWNTKTQNGSAAETGVYLVYCSDQELDEAFIGKIVVVK